MPRWPTRTSSSIWRPDPSRECAEPSLHAPSAGGGRPYQSCGNGCIRVWYKRDHIEPRIGGPSTHLGSRAVHKTTFGARVDHAWNGWDGTGDRTAQCGNRGGDPCSRMTAIAGIRKSSGSSLIGFIDVSFRRFLRGSSDRIRLSPLGPPGGRGWERADEP